MEDGDSNSPWSRLENPASVAPAMTPDAVAGPLTPYPVADIPTTKRPSTSATQQQNNGASNNLQCQGRDLLGCLPHELIER